MHQHFAGFHILLVWNVECLLVVKILLIITIPRECLLESRILTRVRRLDTIQHYLNKKHGPD